MDFAWVFVVTPNILLEFIAVKLCCTTIIVTSLYFCANPFASVTLLLAFFVAFIVTGNPNFKDGPCLMAFKASGYYLAQSSRLPWVMTTLDFFFFRYLGSVSGSA